jgi:hypothetical protein
MRFAVGEAVVDVIVDDDDFELPLGFLPAVDADALARHRAVLDWRAFYTVDRANQMISILVIRPRGSAYD